MLCSEVSNGHSGTALEMYKSNPEQEILMGFGHCHVCEQSFIFPECIYINQKKDEVMMQVPPPSKVPFIPSQHK